MNWFQVHGSFETSTTYRLWYRLCMCSITATIFFLKKARHRGLNPNKCKWKLTEMLRTFQPPEFLQKPLLQIRGPSGVGWHPSVSGAPFKEDASTAFLCSMGCPVLKCSLIISNRFSWGRDGTEGWGGKVLFCELSSAHSYLCVTKNLMLSEFRKIKLCKLYKLLQLS